MRPLPAPEVPGEGHWSWASQARQYPEHGSPGVRYEHFDTVIGEVTDPFGVEHKITAAVDVLLHYSVTGHLTGILCHYPQTIMLTLPGGREMPLEEAGNVSLWVHPRRRRRGIGAALLAECERRWSIDWWAQKYTEGGHALITSYLRKRGPDGPPND